MKVTVYVAAQDKISGHHRAVTLHVQSATTVILHPLGLGLFEYTFENAQWRTSKTNATIVTLYLLMQVL